MSNTLTQTAATMLRIVKIRCSPPVVLDANAADHATCSGRSLSE